MSDIRLPQNLDAERAILGAILVRNSALDAIVDRIHAEHFSRDGHQRIFAAMLRLYAKGVGIDLVTLKDALAQAGDLDAVGGVATLTGLPEGVPSAMNIGYYASLLRRTATARSVILMADELQRQAQSDDVEAAALIETAEQALLELSVGAVPGDLVAGADMAAAIVPALEELFASRRPVTGVPTGLPTLDGYTRGMHPGALIVVAGRPGSGKSSLALQMALDVARSGPVAFFSVEMGQQEQTFRALSVLGRVDGHRLQSGYLGAEEQQRVGRALNELGERRFYLDESGALSVLQIRSRCRRLKARHGLKLVIVDYLQLLQHPGKADSREQAVAATTRALKQVARELAVPVLVLSQLSRKVEERAGKRPQLSDLRESGSIEQDADVVLLIYRPDPVETSLGKEQGPTELILAKQRNGPTGSIELVWMGEQFRFAELAREGV